MNYDIMPKAQAWLSVITGAEQDYTPADSKKFHLHFEGQSAVSRLKRKYYHNHLCGDVYKLVGKKWVLYGQVVNGQWHPDKTKPGSVLLA